LLCEDSALRRRYGVVSYGGALRSEACCVGAERRGPLGAGVRKRTTEGWRCVQRLGVTRSFCCQSGLPSVKLRVLRGYSWGEGSVPRQVCGEACYGGALWS
jgi:hypothetical protein